MKIETTSIQQNRIFMKKSLRKFFSSSLKKLKQQKDRIKKLRFSAYQEDFVVTDQEEREGGFFGNVNFKILSPIK
jgi:hypothetical protein